MILKEKSLFWYLTFPFAHNNYTTIGKTIYYPKNNPPDIETIAHERIHMRQQYETGILKYIFLYLFCFPILWNKWRFKWEKEAFLNGSNYKISTINEILRSSSYGWLQNE